MKENMESKDKTIADGLKETEIEVERMLLILEDFAKGMSTTKLKEKIVVALFAKHLRMNVKDFNFLITTVKSGKLRRELFK